MSRTVNDIIKHAFESSGIVRVGAEPSGVHFDYALRTLNEMLDKWTSDGIAHGLADVTTATIVYNGALSSAVRKNLAVEMADGPYAGKVSSRLFSEAMDEKNNLMPYEGEVDYDRALSISRGYDIDQGQYT